MEKCHSTNTFQQQWPPDDPGRICMLDVEYTLVRTVSSLIHMILVRGWLLDRSSDGPA